MFTELTLVKDKLNGVGGTKPNSMGCKGYREKLPKHSRLNNCAA